jgi:hypothetical protein
MQGSEPDRSGQVPGQNSPAPSDVPAVTQPLEGGAASTSAEVSEDRRPAHQIAPDPPKCPDDCKAIAVVPDETIKDDSWVFLPPDSGLKGRVLFAPAISGKGRKLVARTAVHGRAGVAGALAHPGLTLRLGRDKEARVFVCARRPNWWELIRFQPGLALAVVVAAITAIAAIFTAEGGFLQGLQGNTSLWFVGAVFAVSLLQAAVKLYKELSDADAGGKGVWIVVGIVVAALVVIVLLSGRGSGSTRSGGNGTGTPSPSSSSAARP